MVRQRNRPGQGPAKAKRSLCRKDSTGSMSEIPIGKDEGLFSKYTHICITIHCSLICLFFMWYNFIPCYRMDRGPARYSCGWDAFWTRGPWKNKEALPKEKNKTRGSFSDLPAGLLPLIKQNSYYLIWSMNTIYIENGHTVYSKCTIKYRFANNIYIISTIQQ